MERCRSRSGATAGGWQSLNELHSQGLVTADRDVARPVARLAREVPSLEHGTLSLPIGSDSWRLAIAERVAFAGAGDGRSRCSAAGGSPGSRGSLTRAWNAVAPDRERQLAAGNR